MLGCWDLSKAQLAIVYTSNHHPPINSTVCRRHLLSTTRHFLPQIKPSTSKPSTKKAARRQFDRSHHFLIPGFLIILYHYSFIVYVFAFVSSVMWLPLHKSNFTSWSKKRTLGDLLSDESDSVLQSGLLQNPKTDRIDGENKHMYGMEIGHSAIQGFRTTMEDQHIIQSMTLEGHTLVAIFDGHAGRGAAYISASKLLLTIESTQKWKEYAEQPTEMRANYENLVSSSLVQGFIDMDRVLRDHEETGASGATAVVSIISPTHIFTASVGDSRCVLGCLAYSSANSTHDSGRVINMTEDHKPSVPEERERIEAAGGFVFLDRVNGELAMSRALGDFRYKDNETLKPEEQQVICVPDVSVHRRGTEDAVLVLACDGVWDMMSNDDAIAFVLDVLLGTFDDDQQQGNAEAAAATTAEMVAEALVDVSLGLGSTDNISAVVVKFSAVAGQEKKE